MFKCNLCKSDLVKNDDYEEFKSPAWNCIRFQGTAGFVSKFDGSMITIILCDDCIEKIADIQHRD